MTIDPVEAYDWMINEVRARIVAEQSRDRWRRMHEEHLDVCEPGHAHCARDLELAVAAEVERFAVTHGDEVRFWSLLFGALGLLVGGAIVAVLMLLGDP